MLTDVRWDPIVAIEPLPPEPVYDIEVEGTHNFLANGILAHNTYLGTSSPGGEAAGGATDQAGSAALVRSGEPAAGQAARTVRLVIRDESGWILLLRLARPISNVEQWELPGGKLEGGETEEGAARREGQEETGLVATGWQRHDSLIQPVETRTGLRDVTVFEASVAARRPPVQLDSDHREAQWFAEDQLPTIALTESSRRSLELALGFLLVVPPTSPGGAAGQKAKGGTIPVVRDWMEETLGVTNYATRHAWWVESGLLKSVVFWASWVVGANAQALFGLDVLGSNWWMWTNVVWGLSFFGAHYIPSRSPPPPWYHVLIVTLIDVSVNSLFLFANPFASLPWYLGALSMGLLSHFALSLGFSPGTGPSARAGVHEELRRRFPEVTEANQLAHGEAVAGLFLQGSESPLPISPRVLSVVLLLSAIVLGMVGFSSGEWPASLVAGILSAGATELLQPVLAAAQAGAQELVQLAALPMLAWTTWATPNGRTLTSRLKQGVVEVRSGNYGSGVVFQESQDAYYVLSAAHVTNSRNLRADHRSRRRRVTVVLPNGERARGIVLWDSGRGWKPDLSLIRIQKHRIQQSSIRLIRLADPDVLRQLANRTVRIFSAPNAGSRTLRTGRVLSTSRYLTVERPILRGFSGGPVVYRQRVIGIAVATDKASADAVPITTILKTLKWLSTSKLAAINNTDREALAHAVHEATTHAPRSGWGKWGAEGRLWMWLAPLVLVLVESVALTAIPAAAQGVGEAVIAQAGLGALGTWAKWGLIGMLVLGVVVLARRWIYGHGIEVGRSTEKLERWMRWVKRSAAGA